MGIALSLQVLYFSKFFFFLLYFNKFVLMMKSVLLEQTGEQASQTSDPMPLLNWDYKLTWEQWLEKINP